MKRKPTWAEDLAAYMESMRGLKFAWGQMDCCLFPAGAVLAMTGIDPAASFRGTYSDSESASIALNAYCSGALPEMLTKMCTTYGWEAIEQPYLQRGDIVTLPSASGDEGEKFGGIIGLCIGPLIAVMARPGILLVAKKHAISSWRI